MISKSSAKRRAYWVEEISKLSGKFGDDSDRLEAELSREMVMDGARSVLVPSRLRNDPCHAAGSCTITDILLNLRSSAGTELPSRRERGVPAGWS